MSDAGPRSRAMPPSSTTQARIRLTGPSGSSSGPTTIATAMQWRIPKRTKSSPSAIQVTSVTSSAAAATSPARRRWRR